MNFYSKRTDELNKIQINEICKLKDTYWKYGLKSQKEFFFDKVNQKDIHNLVLNNKKIIGYTLLRKSKIKFSTKHKKYFHFDTLIIDKRFRKKKISNKLMELNNKTIKKKNSFSILLCDKSMINFYKKFSWNVIQKKNILGKKSKKTYMIYNKKINEKFSFK